MKQTLITISTTIVLLFVSIFVYTKLVGPLPLTVTSVVTQKSDTFAVSGEGKATVIPDIARVSLGVTSQGATVKQVQTDLNTKINSVSSAVKNIGIESKDIQTNNYSIHPQYDYSGGRQRITGYEASSNLAVVVRNIDKANEVIDSATAAGANTVGGISFDIEDKKKAENEAREKAVAEAKSKATEASRIAGFRLGNIVNYNESFGGGVMPRPLMYAEKAMDSAVGMGGGTAIETGSTEIQVTVTLWYELR